MAIEDKEVGLKVWIVWIWDEGDEEISDIEIKGIGWGKDITGE